MKTNSYLSLIRLSDHWRLRKSLVVKKVTFLMTTIALLNLSAFSQYCVPATLEDPGDWGDYVWGFSTTNGLTNIDNVVDTYGDPWGYEDFTAMSCSSYPNGSLDFSALVGGFDPHYCVIWIDWDNDEEFEAGEIVYEENTTQYYEHVGTITVPMAQALGDYRLRVRSSYFLNTSPCDDIDYGEAEDYTFTVVAAPACPNPSALSAFGGIDSATLGWTENGTATEWEIEYGEAPYTFTGIPNVPGVGTNPYLLSSLEETTNYVFYVRAVCGVGDESGWVGPFSFSTVPVVAAPYATTFNSAPSGWTTNGWSVTWPDDFTEGNVLAVNVYSFNPTRWVSSVDIGPLPAGSELTYNYVISDWGWDEDAGTFDDASLLVEISTDFGASWTTLDTYTAPPAGWNPESFDLSAYEDDIVRIRFTAHYGTTSDVNVAVDDFYVGPPPTCAAPTALGVTNHTTSSVDLTWTENGTATEWDIEWGEFGFSPTGTPTIENVGSNPYTLGSLDAETDYQFYVRADCGGLDGESVWAGPFLFYAVVENDACSGAIAVECDGGPYTGSTLYATNENLSLCGFDPEDNEQFSLGVWYVFEGTGEDVTASLCGSGYDTRINVFSGSCGSLTCVGGSDDFCSLQSEVTFPTSNGVDYYILVHGYGALSYGNYTLAITCAAACSPVTTNDDCADATSITVQPGTGGTYTSANDECAFPSAIGTDGCSNPFSTLRDIFYTFNSGSNTGLFFESSVIGVDAPAASGNYFVALYEGTDCDAVYYGCAGFTMGGQVYIDGLDVNTDYLMRIYTSSSSVATRGNFDFMVKQIAVPDNDECSGAIALTLNVEVDATTIGATESLPAGACGGDADDDVWFSFVAPSFMVDIEVDVPDLVLDPVIEVRSGACNGSEVACSDDFMWFSGTEELLNLDLVEGQTYFVRIYGADEGLKGDFSILYKPSYIPPPANDNPALNTPTMNAASNVYPNCITVQGTTTGATISPGFEFGFLPDVWYQFNAISNGVSITIDATFDSELVLWEFDGVNTLTEVDAEDAIWFASGIERLNFGGLTEGSTYYIQVNDWDEDGGDFSICVQKLKKPYCGAAPGGGYSLCSTFKPVISGAATATVTFDDGTPTSITSGSQIPLSTASLGLLYNTTYNIGLVSNFNLFDGNGDPELVTVPGTAVCSITTVAQPPVDVKPAQRCPATLFRSSFLQAAPVGVGIICGVIGYNIEFTRAASCSDYDGDPLSTFTRTVNTATAQISLNIAFNEFPIANNPNIGYWIVRWQPIFAGNVLGNWGNERIISVNGTSTMDMVDDNSDSLSGLEGNGSNLSANLYPNPNNGDMVNLNMTGITSNDVYVRIMDGMGRVVYTNRYTVEGSLNTIVTFSKPLASGLYMVEFTSGTDVITQRLMVSK